MSLICLFCGFLYDSLSNDKPCSAWILLSVTLYSCLILVSFTKQAWTHPLFPTCLIFLFRFPLAANKWWADIASAISRYTILQCLSEHLMKGDFFLFFSGVALSPVGGNGTAFIAVHLHFFDIFIRQPKFSRSTSVNILIRLPPTCFLLLFF